MDTEISLKQRFSMTYMPTDEKDKLKLRPTFGTIKTSAKRDDLFVHLYDSLTKKNVVPTLLKDAIGF